MSTDVLKSIIDVSEWQNVIAWAKVKLAGIVGALIRAGYGDTLSYPNQIDKQFERNYSECKRVGMPVGVYYYCYATTVEQAQREAYGCLALLKGKQFEYPIFYDVEELDTFRSGKTNEIIKAFADILESAGYWVGVYIYRSAAQTYLTERTRTRYAMAIAEYGSKLNYSGQYGIWQNSSTSYVNGINGRVDHDYCYVDYPKLIKEKGKNGYKAEFRVAATHGCYTYDGKDKPYVNGVYPTGAQWTIEKVVNHAGTDWGKIKGADKFVRMSDVQKI